MPDFSDYIVFADESGDHGLQTFSTEYPVFVLAFAMVRKQTYYETIVPALQRMKMEFFGHDQVVFHERDIRKQLPPFGFLRSDPTLRTAFLARMNEVVGNAAFELFCSVIHKDRLKARYANPWNPYDIALMFCMERVRERLLALGQANRRIHVVFEGRGRPEDTALELAFAEFPPTLPVGVGGRPTFQSANGSR